MLVKKALREILNPQNVSLELVLPLGIYWVEVGRLRPQLEEERRKVAELCAVYQSGGAPDVAGLLEVASREKELLEEALEHLRIDLEQSHSGNIHLQEDIEKVRQEVLFSNLCSTCAIVKFLL